jgi:hypothetical protein
VLQSLHGCLIKQSLLSPDSFLSSTLLFPLTFSHSLHLHLQMTARVNRNLTDSKRLLLVTVSKDGQREVEEEEEAEGVVMIVGIPPNCFKSIVKTRLTKRKKRRRFSKVS